MKLVNNTRGASRIGTVVKVDPSDPNAFVLAIASDTKVLGIVAETVAYRSLCEVTTYGEAKVLISGNISRGNTVRNRKSTDGISNGWAALAKTTDAPYLQIGTALESGNGLVRCELNFAYQFADDDSASISINDINHPVRIVTDTTTELTTDYHIVCDKPTAMTVNLLPATGGRRIRIISNIDVGVVTVNGNGGDIIDGELTQELYEQDSMDIQDYELGKWKVI